MTVAESLLFLRGLGGALRARGFRVHAATARGEMQNRFRAEDGVATHIVDITRQITPGADLVAFAQLWSLCRRLRPDIVHAHTPKAGLLGMLAATAARVPRRIYHLRGLPAETSTGLKRAVLLASERVACRLAHSVLCVSSSLRRSAIEHGLCPDAKIKVLANGSGNGVDAEGYFSPCTAMIRRGNELRASLGIGLDARVVGYVGRIARDKGIEVLIDAWRAVASSDANAHLVVVGPVDCGKPLAERFLTALASLSRVSVIGPQRDVRPYYAAMDVLCLPTWREGFPNVILEAAAYEVPTVASAVTGCVDAVVDGVTGTLVPPRDADMMAEALLNYLRDPVKRRRDGCAGRQRVLAKFLPRKIWSATAAEYERLLGCTVC